MKMDYHDHAHARHHQHGTGRLEKQDLCTKATAMSPSDLIEHTFAISDNAPPGFHCRAAEMFIEQYGNSYRDTDLAAAVASGNEILLSGVYRAVRDVHP